MALEKAKFVNEYDNNVISVQFNPASLSITSHAMISEQKTQQIDSDVSIISNRGIQSRQLSVSLIFDSYKQQDSILTSKQSDVTSVIDSFEDFMNSYDQVSFIWGKIIFNGCIESLSVRYEMFDAGGVPVRATVELSMKESAFQGQGSNRMDVDRFGVDLAGSGDFGEEDIMSLFGGIM